MKINRMHYAVKTISKRIAILILSRVNRIQTILRVANSKNHHFADFCNNDSALQYLRVEFCESSK